MCLTDKGHPIVTRGPRAPPHRILPAFLNLHGTKTGRRRRLIVKVSLKILEKDLKLQFKG